MQALIIAMTRSVLCALRGEVPDNVHNTEVIPRWRSRFAGKSVWGVQPDPLV
jgi:hypothetical protein